MYVNKNLLMNKFKLKMDDYFSQRAQFNIQDVSQASGL